MRQLPQMLSAIHVPLLADIAGDRLIALCIQTIHRLQGADDADLMLYTVSAIEK